MTMNKKDIEDYNAENDVRKIIKHGNEQ